MQPFKSKPSVYDMSGLGAFLNKSSKYLQPYTAGEGPVQSAERVTPPERMRPQNRCGTVTVPVPSCWAASQYA
jgi:hypothetical protein